MQDIVELQRRITAAIERIGLGLDRQISTGQDAAGQGAAEQEAEILRLTEALDEERMANAQLNERLRVIKERESAGSPDAAESGPEFGAEADALRAQLAAQADEIATLRRVLAEAGKEIATLRAARAAEAEELSDIVGALEPLVAEAEKGAIDA